MTDEEFKMTVITDLAALKQELKGFNGNPGLCKKVRDLEKTVRRIIYALCLAGGSGGIWAAVSELLGG